MLLAVSRHNLSEDLVTGDSLPIPALPGPADTLQPGDVAQVSCDWWMVMVILISDWSRQFLKLILGVAVTCSNKLLFISTHKCRGQDPSSVPVHGNSHNLFPCSLQLNIE